MLYILMVNLYRTKNSTENEIDFYEEFRDDDIFEARRRCFIKFKSFIDVMLMPKGKKYISHEQAKRDLRDFIYLDNPVNKLGLPIIENGMGLSIVFVYDDEVEFVSKDESITFYKKGITIHGINNETNYNFDNLYLKNLKKEYKIYLINNLQVPENMKDRRLRIIRTPINYSNSKINKFSF